MDVGLHTPFIDFFRRGEVGKDVRMLAAQGAVAPRAHEQLALLALLTEDPEPDVRGTAEATLARVPHEALAAFLGRVDVPDGLREFFLARGVSPAAGSVTSGDDPLVDTSPDVQAADPAAPTGVPDEEAARQGAAQRLAMMTIAERMKAAMKGTKEERAVLVRDPNKLVSTAVLSSPKLTDSEVESFSKMANVSEEVLRIIGNNRSWLKNYGVIAGLAKNPKTPLSISMRLVQRLSDRDLKMISLDRNIQEPLKLAIRKRMVNPEKQ